MAADTPPAKLVSLLRYIRERVPEKDPIWYATVIYLADLESYHQSGKTITGASWVRKSWGVEPKGFWKALEMVYNEGT
jgi:hypothetical protein